MKEKELDRFLPVETLSNVIKNKEILKYFERNFGITQFSSVKIRRSLDEITNEPCREGLLEIFYINNNEDIFVTRYKFPDIVYNST